MTITCAKTCASPGCTESAGAGRWGNFCTGHADQLAEIANSYTRQGQNMRRAGLDPKSKNRKRRPRKSGPTCTLSGCDNPRTPPSAFCDECVAAGAYDED
jgi:hypothetical protein